MNRRVYAHVGVMLALIAVGLMGSSAAWGQGAGAVAAANALFNEAKEDAKSGNWTDACPKFKKSYELDEQLGTLLNLADCYDNEGKVASAWARWSDALAWAKRDANTSRIEFADKRMKESEARLPKVNIRVANPIYNLTVKRGDVVVDEVMWGTPIPVDPGPMVVKVLRGERVLESHPIHAKEAATTVVELDLAEIDRKFPKLPDPEPQDTGFRPPVPPAPVTPEPYDPTHRNVGIIVGVVGLAAVLAAGGLEIGALVKKGQADEPDACVNNFCSRQGLEDAESAATFAEVGQWVGIGGLVVLAVGVTIFFTAPAEEEDDDPEEPAMSLAPWATPRGGGLVVGGTF